jgi:tRNA(fMet)-specific endonuclease VapC
LGLILDTSFVISLEREGRRGVRGRAHSFLLAQKSTDTLFITFTVTGELACGQSAADRRDWELLCQPYPILPWTLEIAWHYGEIYRALAARGQLIGANDMWIAATGLAHGFDVVTGNQGEFSRVPGLLVKSF